MNIHVNEPNDHHTATDIEAAMIDTLDALAEEMRGLDAMAPDEGPMPDRMAAADLHETELFQVRAGIDSYHVDSLARALELDGDLQPLLVLRRGGRVYLIDGWHRKRAYEAARRGDSVPIIEFQGTPQDALLEGQRLNKMHTLAMTKDERMNGAWKLVKLDATNAGRFTLKQITAVGVSRSHATFMRRVHRELGAASADYSRWKDALRAHSQQPDREYSEQEIESMIEAEAAQVADQMARQWGTRLSDKPDVFARAVEIFVGRRITQVVRILNERNEPEEEGEYGQDFEF